jgi:imidazolonepropionase-like amidohydrolase
VASTSRPTEILKNTDTGSLAVGKRADFVVLNANPLEDIRNTRSIEAVYFNGAKLDRDRIAAAWKRSSTSR